MSLVTWLERWMAIGEICSLGYVLPDVAFLANHKGKKFSNYS